ncbi:MAG TPA: hypothetical protein VJ505_05205 [Holophagaceae bacterium]|nr:hypothetical protein [Holophagaceae bacterium]
MRPIALLLLAPALVAQAPALSVDQLLAKNFEAKGGLAKIKALKSVKMTGRLMQGPMEIAISGIQARGAFRMEVSVQGMTQITAFDGKAGWKIDPFQGYGGGKNAEAFTADEMKAAEVQADLDGPVVDYAAKGHKVEYMGKDTVEGAPAHKLKVTLKNGDVQTYYLDADSYLEVKQTSKRKIREQEVEMETYYGDFREVAGVLMPFSIEQGMPGMPQRAKIIVDKIEPNVTLDPASLKMPAPVAAPAAPAVK